MKAIIKILFILHLQVNYLEAKSGYNYDFSNLEPAPTLRELAKVHEWWMPMRTPTGTYEDEELVKVVFKHSTDGVDVIFSYYNDTSCGHHKTSKSHYVDNGLSIMTGFKELFLFHCTSDKSSASPVVVANIMQDYETENVKLNAFMLAPWEMSRKRTDKIIQECITNMLKIEKFYFILLDRPCSASTICSQQ